MELSNFLDRRSQSYFWTEHAIHKLRVQVELERILEDLELISDAFAHTKTLFHIQVGALEFGRLTEDILPPSVLTDCLSHGAASRDSVMVKPIQWYYRYSTVQPMWGDADYLVFKVVLPLVSDTAYIQYSIRTFPVPLAPGSLVRLNAEGGYGYNTINGYIFQLDKCLGENPTVCDTTVM